MNPLSRRLVTVILPALIAGWWAGCASPTLPPLPPPSRPVTITSEAGEVYVEGQVPIAQARVLVLNNNSDLISGQFIYEGRYAFTIRAQPGDILQLWYSSGTHTSASVAFEAPEPKTQPGTEPSDAGE